MFLIDLTTASRSSVPPACLYQSGEAMELAMASSEIRGVAVDSLGNVYVSDSGNSRIQKFSSSGVFLSKWGSVGIGDGQFNFSQGVAVDSLG